MFISKDILYSAFKLARSLIYHEFGIFPAHGFEEDVKYPKTFTIGGVTLENKGCSLNKQVK